MPNTGPVVLSVVGDSYIQSGAIAAILWEGETTAGDTCEVRDRKTGNLLFPGRAVGAQTWQGVVLRMSTPNGFTLTQISSGRVLVWLDEP